MFVPASQPVRRLSRRDDAFMVPRPLAGEPGRFVVDATWGTVTPMELAPGVRTIGELEVIDHIAAGAQLIDTRLRTYLETGALPTARSIPHNEIAARLDEISTETPVVLFCNGPQCLATPDAIHTLLKAGYPPDQLRYYRGGIHDWVTLGLPLEPAAD